MIIKQQLNLIKQKRKYTKYENGINSDTVLINKYLNFNRATTQRQAVGDINTEFFGKYAE